MTANEQHPSPEPSLRGTPRDYSTDMYRVYFEVGEHEGRARQAIEEFLGPKRAEALVALPYGYECELAIQVVPDIVRELAKRNIAVYQVVRYAKTKSVWI